MPQKRKADEGGEFADWWTANVLGATTGTVLRGITRLDTGVRTATPITYDSVAGVRLEVAQGCVLPHESAQAYAKKLWDKPGKEGWSSKLASKLHNVSPSQAQLLIDQFQHHLMPADKEGMLGNSTSKPNTGEAHCLPHEGRRPLRFRILATGAWSHSQQMLDWLADRTLVEPKQLITELDRAQKADPAGNRPGFLALRPHLWVAETPTGKVPKKKDEDIDVDVNKVLGLGDKTEDYVVKVGNRNMFIRMPAGTDAPLTLNDVPITVMTSVTELLSEESKFNVVDDEGVETREHLFGELFQGDLRVQVESCTRKLIASQMHFGALKSLIQKVARVQAKTISYDFNGESEKWNGAVTAMAGLAMLFTSRGSGFVPDLGLYVRGQVAALKRLGVVMVEDAWPEKPHLNGLPGNRDPGVVLEAILAAALVCSQVDDYHCPNDLIRSCLKVMAASACSSQVIAWRENVDNATVTWRVSKPALDGAARILRELRSFKGDMDMFDQVASSVNENGRMLMKENPHDIGGVVPIEHVIDQHVYRGVAHTLLDFPGTESSFPSRFKMIFNRVTGFSPRLADHLLDETDPIVCAVRTAQRMIGTHVFNGSKPYQVEAPMEEELEVALDYGVMSAGVGVVGPFRVSTSAAENLEDGFMPGGKQASSTWNLLVILPVEKRGEIVIHYVSAHSNDNSKKPPITASAKRKAVAACRAKKTYPFSSPMMRGYTSVHYSADSDHYIVAGAYVDDMQWSFDVPNTISVPYVKALNAPGEEGLDWQDDDTVHKWLSETENEESSPVMIAGWEHTLGGLVRTLATPATQQGFDARTMLVRMVGFLKQQYTDVTLPTPGLKGEQASDQLKPEPGDWMIWRMLLAISRLCPGALRPVQVPRFKVVDSRLLRMVEEHLKLLVLSSDADAGTQATWSDYCSSFEAGWALLPTPREPFDYQATLVNTMLKRDREAIVRTQGHFVSLETGLGKTLVGLYYALKYAAAIGGVSRVLWVAPMKVIATTLKEACTDWGLKMQVHIGEVNRKNPVFRDNFINVVGFEWFSTGGSRGALEKSFLESARGALVVFDEVHTMYNANIRASTMRDAALASVKFVCMTATPIGAPSQALALDWLKDTVGFPLARDNQLVAAAMMVAARVELPIEGLERVQMCSGTDALDKEHKAHLLAGDWAEAAKAARGMCSKEMARMAVELAIADIAEHGKGGGVLVVLDNQSELDDMTKRITDVRDSRVGANVGKVAQRNPDTTDDPNFGILLVTKNDVTGYNMQRMGAILTGVYASSAAKRHQMRGRIRRVGQKRKSVQYWTFVPESTILELLFKRHNSVDKKNESLKDLAEEYVNSGGV